METAVNAAIEQARIDASLDYEETKEKQNDKLKSTNLGYVSLPNGLAEASLQKNFSTN